MSFDPLPSELLFSILEFLPIRDLNVAFRVSASLSRFSTYEPLWQSLYHSTYLRLYPDLCDRHRDSDALSFRDKIRHVHFLFRSTNASFHCGHVTDDVTHFTGVRSHALVGKFVMYGLPFAGKTSLLLRFARNEFDDCLESTIGAAYLTHVIEGSRFEDVNYPIQMDIWDHMGYAYRPNVPMYYRGACGVIAAVDMSDSRSSLDRLFQNLENVCHDMAGFRQFVYPPIICLVGTKFDIVRDWNDLNPNNPNPNHFQSVDEIMSVLESVNPEVARFVSYTSTTSSKTGEGVAEVFEWVAHRSARCFLGGGGKRLRWHTGMTGERPFEAVVIRRCPLAEDEERPSRTTNSENQNDSWCPIL